MPRAPQGTSTSKQDSEYLAAWNATMQLLREGKSFSGRERNCAFLNCGPRQPFANVSAVTGFDFADDARVIALVDWDQDGDLDCWLHNRTGPRLRLMQNQTNKQTNQQAVGGSRPAGRTVNSMSIRLQGTKSNRDAIGARVELLFRDATLPRQLQTLHAGDAFLSQSSKWLHFGLGKLSPTDVRAVSVRWPHGNVEEFALDETASRLLLVEGSSVSQATARSAEGDSLTPRDQPSQRTSKATRVPLFNRPPMPLLDVTSVATPDITTTLEISGRPTLLVLWASWCGTCQNELPKLAKAKLNFDVIGVSVDAVSTNKGSTENTKSAMTSTSEAAKAWGLSFPIYSATPESLDKLSLLGRVTLNRKTELAVPTSFLVDANGRLAAIYRGGAELSVVQEDVDALDLNLKERRNRAVPFAGKWTSPPSTLLIRPVAGLFRDRGYTDDYSRLLKIEMDDVRARRAQASSAEQRLTLDRQWAGDNFNIAFAHEKQREFSTAVDYYRQGLEVTTDDNRAWVRLSACLVAMGKSQEAIGELTAAVSKVSASAEIHIALAKLLRAGGNLVGAERELRAAVAADGQSATAHFQLGSLLLGKRMLSEAEASFRAATAADPNHFESLLNLGALLSARGEATEASQVLRQTVRLRPSDVRAKLNLALALQKSNDIRGAERELRSALTLAPKNAQVHLGLAKLALSADRPKEVRDHFEAALQINPKDTASKLRLAWLLATTWDAAVRDPERALQLARELNTEAKNKHPIILDTLAAASAATGDFESAEKSAIASIEILSNAKQTKMGGEVSERLKLYRKQTPFVSSRTSNNGE